MREDKSRPYKVIYKFHNPTSSQNSQMRQLTLRELRFLKRKTKFKTIEPSIS